MSAKEMMIELDFKQVVDNDRQIVYIDIDNPDLYISFDKLYKTIVANQTYDYNFDYKMLQAINKQVEELGWNK